MKIAVCVKLTPTSAAPIKFATGGAALDLAGVECAPGPYDEYALEAALLAREKFAGSTFAALAVGGDEMKKALEHAAALGADDLLLVKAPGADVQAAARCAAAALKQWGAELVLCGRQAIDDDQWGFPGMLAELLGWPHLTALSTLEYSSDGKQALARRRVDGGEEEWDAQLPAVLSCDKGLNAPRAPTLKGRMNAKKKAVTELHPAALGMTPAMLEPALKVVAYAPPAAKSPGKVLTAPPAESAAELVRLLRTEAKVL